MSEPGAGRVVPLARHAAVALGGATAVVLAASPVTRWYARLRRRNDPGYGDELPLLFDVNTEATVPTWYSAALLLVLAGLCGLLIAVSVAAGVSGGRRWAVLAVAFAGMSLDEAVALHERLGSVVADTLGVTTGALRHPWVIAGAALAASLLAVAAWAVVTLPRGPRRGVALGLGLYVGGALALEALSGAVLDAAGEGIAYSAVTWCEEAAEMAGAVVMCSALLAALDVRVHDGSLRVGLASPRRESGP